MKETAIPTIEKVGDWSNARTQFITERLVLLDDVRPDRLVILSRSNRPMYVREMVVNMLLLAASKLPMGHRLVIWDGWRPTPSETTYIHEDSLSKPTNGHLLCTNCIDNHALTHLSGGSVDVTFANESGELANMGTINSQNAEISTTRYFEKKNQTTKLTEEEKEILLNRRILYNAMTSVGFTNCPDKWWHYDFGNQHWSSMTGKPAFYSETSPK
jgi:zinc D-Ala-D-Ala dipeptidase